MFLCFLAISTFTLSAQTYIIDDNFLDSVKIYTIAVADPQTGDETLGEPAFKMAMGQEVEVTRLLKGHTGYGAIEVDGNTWNTKDIWSSLYEFDLWKGIVYENEEDRDPKTAWYNIYLFDDSDAYGLCAWGDNGSTNPQLMSSSVGNYVRNGNEITLYTPEIELILFFTINGDVMTSEIWPGIEFKKLK